MTNLSITAKTNVDECIQIDYITILTKDGKEIDLNWEYSHYTPFEPFNSPHSILETIIQKCGEYGIDTDAAFPYVDEDY